MREFVVPIIVHDGELPVPEHKSWGDWIDLRSAEDVEMKQGEYRIISLGVSMRLPYGFEAHVVPRSSTYKNFGIILANSFGVIDNSYHGDNDVWGFPAIAMRDTVIHKGDRIAQFRIVQRQPRLVFVTVSYTHLTLPTT